MRYVSRVSSASGRPIPLRGAADLEIVTHALAYTTAGKATYAPRNPADIVDVRRFRTLRQVRFVESFEGETIIGLGVRARLPFRVFATTTGARQSLVVDVAHTR